MIAKSILDKVEANMSQRVLKIDSIVVKDGFNTPMLKKIPQ